MQVTSTSLFDEIFAINRLALDAHHAAEKAELLLGLPTPQDELYDTIANMSAFDRALLLGNQAAEREGEHAQMPVGFDLVVEWEAAVEAADKAEELLDAALSAVDEERFLEGSAESVAVGEFEFDPSSADSSWLSALL